MGLFDSIRQRLSGKSSQTFNLQNLNRQQIVQILGQFDTNKLAQDSNTQFVDGYDGNVDVYSLIKRIIDTGKIIPRVLEQKKGDEWVKVEGGNSITELMESPNNTKGYTWVDIMEQLTLYFQAAGNGLMSGANAIGFGDKFMELDVLPTGLTEIQNLNNSFTNPLPHYQLTIGGKVINYTNEEVGHVKLFNPAYQDTTAMLVGLSPIQVAANLVKVGNSTLEAQASIYQNRGAYGLVTDKSNAPMNPDEAQAVQQAFQSRAAGTHNTGKTIVTNKDLNYIQLAMSPSDLKLIESGVVNLRALCNVYGLDSSLFNDPANKTFNNRKEADKALYTNAVMPQNDKIDSMLTNWLVENHFPGGTHRLRSDYSDVESLQQDFNTKASTYVSLVSAGIASRETAAQELNLPEPPIVEPQDPNSNNS